MVKVSLHPGPLVRPPRSRSTAQVSAFGSAPFGNVVTLNAPFRREGVGSVRGGIQDIVTTVMYMFYALTLVPARGTCTDIGSFAQVTNGAHCRAVSRVIRRTFPASSRCTILTTKDGFPSTLTTSSLTKTCGTPVVLASSCDLSDRTSFRVRHLKIHGIFVVNKRDTVSTSIRRSVHRVRSSVRVRQVTNDAHCSATLRVCGTLASSGAEDRTSGMTVVTAKGDFTSTLSVSPCTCRASSPFFLDSPSNLSPSSLRVLRSNTFGSIVVTKKATTIPRRIRAGLRTLKVGMAHLSKNAHCRADGSVNRFILGGLGSTPRSIMFTAKSGFPSTLTNDTLSKSGGATVLLIRSDGSPAVSFTTRGVSSTRGICILKKGGTIGSSALGTVTQTCNLKSRRDRPRPPTPRPAPRPGPRMNARSTKRFYGGTSINGIRCTGGNELVIYRCQGGGGAPR